MDAELKKLFDQYNGLIVAALGHGKEEIPLGCSELIAEKAKQIVDCSANIKDLKRYPGGAARRETLYDNLDELIGKFKDGQKLFRSNAMFNQCVQAMARGADPYEVFQMVIITCQDTQKAFETHLMHYGYPSLLRADHDKS